MIALILTHAIALVFGFTLGVGGIYLLAVWLDPVRRVKRAAKKGHLQ